MTATTTVASEMEVAERKAWDALGRYKFLMFGYWAAIWVHLNRLNGQRQPNPWRCLVDFARTHAHEPANAKASKMEQPT